MMDNVCTTLLPEYTCLTFVLLLNSGLCVFLQNNAQHEISGTIICFIKHSTRTSKTGSLVECIIMLKVVGI